MTTKRLLSVVLGLLLGMGSVTVVSSTAAYANGCGVLAGGRRGVPSGERALRPAVHRALIYRAK